MAWSVPDKGTAQNDLQSILFARYHEALVAGIDGVDCVLTGCGVTAQGSPDMTCAVASGTVLSNGVRQTVSSGNVTIGAADGTNPRFDLVVANSSGTKAVRAGTAAAVPVPPARSANDVVLAVVYVPASDTTISSTQIVDLRVIRSLWLSANPQTDDGTALGTTALRWSDLFLASGAVIDFNNGNVTLTHGSAKVTIAGGGLILAAGGTSQAPLVFNVSGSLQTTPSAGAMEMDANCLYATTDAGNRGVIPVQHVVRADTTRTFGTGTAQQAIFTTPTNGTLTLETGVYEFEGLIAMTAMSGTSGNGKFSLIGAGSATLGSILWFATGLDGTAEQTAFSCGGTWHTIATQTIADIVTAQTAQSLCFYVRGTFEVTGAGTIIPSFAQTTSTAAAVVSVGSYLKFNRIGSTSMTSVGDWS